MESAAPLSVQSLPEARWSCQGCGVCCERFTLGPLTPDTLARLEAADLPSLWPPAAAAAWYEERPGPDGRPAFFLARRAGTCIFLDAQHQCAVHRLLGEGAKPEFCRVFPLLLVPEPAAVRATVRPVCPRWYASRLDGEPLGPQAEALLPCLPQAPPAAQGLVEILPGAGVERASWDAVEPALLRVAGAPEGSPEARVAALRRALLRALGRSEAPPDPAAEQAARGRLLEVLRAPLRALDPGPADPDPRAALLRRCRAWLAPLDPDTPPTACSPDAEDYLGLVLRNALFGRGPLAPGGLPVTMGSFLLDTWIARALPSATPLSAALVADRLAAWQIVAAHAAVQAALARARPSLADLFLYADGP
ncbi:MAG: YkgJ family cysteine cluster protein [Pseudomonadota bacterium]